MDATVFLDTKPRRDSPCRQCGKKGLHGSGEYDLGEICH